MIEKWIQSYQGTDDQAFNTGIQDIDELLEVLLSTSMFTSGILGCFFDNVLPGKCHISQARTVLEQYFR